MKIANIYWRTQKMFRFLSILVPSDIIWKCWFELDQEHGFYSIIHRNCDPLAVSCRFNRMHSIYADISQPSFEHQREYQLKSLNFMLVRFFMYRSFFVLRFFSLGENSKFQNSIVTHYSNQFLWCMLYLNSILFWLNERIQDLTNEFWSKWKSGKKGIAVKLNISIKFSIKKLLQWNLRNLDEWKCFFNQIKIEIFSF